MLVMTSLPLARVFQCLFTFALVSTLCWLAEIWQLSRQGATGELKVEFKLHRCSCKFSFLFLPCCQSTPESSLAGCSAQGWETNLKIQTLAFYVCKRRVLSPSHCATLKLPAPFYPHIYSHWTMIFPWPPAPSSSFTSLLQWLCFILWQLNFPASLSPPSTCIWIFWNRKFFFVDSKISSWICLSQGLSTGIQHVSISTLVPRTPRGILATEHAS